VHQRTRQKMGGANGTLEGVGWAGLIWVGLGWVGLDGVGLVGLSWDQPKAIVIR